MRVGVILSAVLGLVVTACSPSEPEPPPGARRLTEEEKPKVVSREHFAVPLDERPVLGKVGNTTCAASDNELPLPTEGEACLSLLKDTIKPDTSAGSVDAKLARVRAAFRQPGPQAEGETVGWVLYSVRTQCDEGVAKIMGNVIYRPDGVEISRAIPESGPLAVEGPVLTKIVVAVCAE
jgi:hypothetical protein